jgi:stage II sporulation protein D
MVVQLPDGKARQYPGQLLVSVQGRQTLRVVNQLPAKTYVTLVVSGETSPGWPLEALKAQAVLTQTRLSRYQAGDRLDDTTQQEVYLGRSHWRPEAAKAVDAVWGQQLVVQGRPLIPFYHASCAGRTSDARVFGQDRQLPGIDSVPCPYCRYAPFGRPTVTFIPAATFKQAFPGGMPAVIQRDSAARPLRVQFQNGKTQSGYAFWLALGQKLGWDKAPGLRYFLAQTASGPIKITSAGAGHGVGLCQLGAAAMARQGKTYRLILKHYFPHATLMLH